MRRLTNITFIVNNIGVLRAHVIFESDKTLGVVFHVTDEKDDGRKIGGLRRVRSQLVVNVEQVEQLLVFGGHRTLHKDHLLHTRQVHDQLRGMTEL